MAAIWTDFRYAFRQLKKAPGFAFTAVLTLALGIGMNAAVFTVFSKVLLRTMPVGKPKELVQLQANSLYETGGINSYGGDNAMYFAYPAYQTLRDGSHTLQGLAASAVQPATIVTGKDADQTMMQLVSGNYFAVMELRPVLGRLLTSADDVYHAPNPVAVLSADYWRSRFGSDPSILNEVVRVNGVPVTIVGIVQHSGLMDDNAAAAFLPITLQPQLDIGHGDQLDNSLDRWLNIEGRLKPDVQRAQAEVELNRLWWNWRRSTLTQFSHHIGNKTDWLKTHLSVTSGARGISLLARELGAPVKALQTMALTVLLIACANVANLLLVRAVRRHAELALRGALGASRGQIVQQVLAEGLSLGALGATAGLAIGWMSMKLLLKFVPESSTVHDLLKTPMDWKVMAFCVAAGIATSILFSLAPAILSTRINLLRALHGQSGAVAGGNGRLRNLFVIGEISLSLALLTGATLFSWTLYQLRNTSPGFATSRVLTFQVDSSALGKSGPQVENDYEAIRAGLLHQPGVQAVVYSNEGLITGDEGGSNITVAGYDREDKELVPDYNWVTPGFFSAMQIPLVAGREFSAQDTAASQRVAVVDEAFVQHYFGGDVQKAMRGQFGFGGGNSVRMDVQIVGVVPTIHATNLAKPPAVPFLYIPYAQTFASKWHNRSHPANFFLRTSGDPAQLAGAVQAVVRQVDHTLPINGLETMEEHLDGALSQTRLMSMLSMTMGGLALALAAIGLYGVLAFTVAQRTREIGIRIAVGADKKNITSLILQKVGGLVAAGMLAGGALAWAGVRLLRQQESGLSAAPLWLYFSAAAVMLAVMLAASYVPARRAASVDPMKALRAE